MQRPQIPPGTPEPPVALAFRLLLRFLAFRFFKVKNESGDSLRCVASHSHCDRSFVAGSQKPQLTAQPVGPRMIPIGGTARAAVSRPPPGRPRGTTAVPGGAVAATNLHPQQQPPTSQNA
jgi:hypothetical protein